MPIPCPCYCSKCCGRLRSKQTVKKHQAAEAESSTSENELDFTSAQVASADLPDVEEGHVEGMHDGNPVEDPIENDNEAAIESDSDEDFYYSGNEDSESRRYTFSEADLRNFTEVLCKFLYYVAIRFTISRVAINYLIKGIKLILAQILGYTKFPNSLHRYSKGFKKFWDGMKKDAVICTSCWAIYPEKETKRCTHKILSSKDELKSCDNPLYALNGKPLKSLIYVPVEKSIDTVLCKYGMLEECIEGLRRIASSSDLMEDVFDGNVFKRLYRAEACDYLEGRSRALPIFLKFSADGFNPFSNRVTYSSYNFMFEILNLPRDVRIKVENMLLFTIAPGPDIPPSMIGILDLVVHEMLRLSETGIKIGGHFVKLKIGLIVADLPAVRKLISFSGHAALQACSFCDFNFSKRPVSETDDLESFDLSSFDLSEYYDVDDSPLNPSERFPDLEATDTELLSVNEELYELDNSELVDVNPRSGGGRGGVKKLDFSNYTYASCNLKNHAKCVAVSKGFN
jgi:hypothetical protein